jgi:hypothetical protein
MIFDLLTVRFVQDGSQSTFAPFLIISVTPVITGLCIGPFHLLLILSLVKAFLKLITEFVIQVTILYSQREETRKLYL